MFWFPSLRREEGAGHSSQQARTMFLHGLHYLIYNSGQPCEESACPFSNEETEA